MTERPTKSNKAKFEPKSERILCKHQFYQGNGEFHDIVLKEFSTDKDTFLDVRVYVTSPNYTGFTKKGIALPYSVWLAIANLIKSEIPNIEPSTLEEDSKDDLK